MRLLFWSFNILPPFLELLEIGLIIFKILLIDHALEPKFPTALGKNDKQISVHCQGEGGWLYWSFDHHIIQWFNIICNHIFLIVLCLLQEQNVF